MTHLRKMMLDELQRRNYAQNTVRSYISAVESSRHTSKSVPIGSGRSTSEPIRFICFATLSSPQAPSNNEGPLCGFSSVRHSDGRIWGIIFHSRNGKAHSLPSSARMRSPD